MSYMQNITFDFPSRIFLGKKVIPRVGRVLALAGHRRLVLVAGQGSIRENGVYESVVESFKKNDIFWTEYWGVTPNADCKHVRDLVQTAREFNAEALVAVGGGSVIDTAKLAAASFASQKDPWDLVEMQKDVLSALPCYAVSTCAGSGAEASCSAIVSNEFLRQKRGLKGPALWPQAVFIDPRVQNGMPWLQTLAGGMDAFSHCLEHYVSGAMDPQPLDLSLTVCSGLMRSLLDALRTLHEHPDTYTARASLAWGAILALNGFAGAGLGGGNWTLHLAAHALGAHHTRIPHGLAIAALLPGWLDLLGNESPHVYEMLEQALKGACSPAESLGSFTQLNDCFSCPGLRDFGVGSDDVASLAATAYADARSHPASQRFFSLSEQFFSDLFLRAL